MSDIIPMCDIMAIILRVIMSRIIPMCDIIQIKNKGFKTESLVLLVEYYLEEGDVAPHTVCSGLGIIGEEVHRNATS